MAKCYFNVNQQRPAQNQAPIARTSRTWGGRGGHHHHRVKCCHTVSGCLGIALTLPRQWSSTGVNTPIPCGSLLIAHTQPCPRISQQANKASSLHSIAKLDFSAGSCTAATSRCSFARCKMADCSIKVTPLSTGDVRNTGLPLPKQNTRVGLPLDSAYWSMASWRLCSS